MSAEIRLRRARAMLLFCVAILGMGWGTAIGAGLLLLFGLLDLAVALPLPVRELALASSGLLGTGAGLAVLWRNRDVRSPGGVGLWLENQVPSLRYALVTLIEGRYGSAGPALEQVVAGTSWREPLLRALTRGTLPLLLAILLLTALRALPSAALGRIAMPHRGDALDRVGEFGKPSADPFHPLLVTLTPPVYSGLAETTVEDPETITGLTGSQLRVEGPGAGPGVGATLRGQSLSVSSAGSRWLVTLPMPDTATPLWLSQGSRRRLLVLDPRPDSVPVVELLAPAGDTVRKEIDGTIALRADTHDDFGLGEGWFEYIVSSGEGENFTFRSGVVGRRAMPPARAGALQAVLQLDSLHLSPGNIVHLRAVARDRNTSTGPGLGYSETRTIRIPRPGESDSAMVDGAAPTQGDSSLLSERMLILLAESLERRRPGLGRGTVVAESRGIARDQASLRRRVADIVFLRLGSQAIGEESEDTAGTEGLSPAALLRAAQQATVGSGAQPLDFSQDETPVVALNRPLLEAYNAMWDAGRELEIGEPGRALPPMRLALAAIQRARQAERLYLRGRPAPIVVDLSKIRLAGNLTDVRLAAVTGRARDPRVVELLLARFTRAVSRLPDAGAIDSLLLLRVDALESAPAFAGGLSDALAALRDGRDATVQLLRARRLLVGPSTAVPEIAPWSVLP